MTAKGIMGSVQTRRVCVCVFVCVCACGVCLIIEINSAEVEVGNNGLVFFINSAVHRIIHLHLLSIANYLLPLSNDPTTWKCMI